MMKYIENYKDGTKKNCYNSLMDSVKLQDMKSIHIDLLHLYTLTVKLSERKTKETVSFTIKSKERNT